MEWAEASEAITLQFNCCRCSSHLNPPQQALFPRFILNKPPACKSPSQSQFQRLRTVEEQDQLNSPGFDEVQTPTLLLYNGLYSVSFLVNKIKSPNNIFNQGTHLIEKKCGSDARRIQQVSHRVRSFKKNYGFAPDHSSNILCPASGIDI